MPALSYCLPPGPEQPPHVQGIIVTSLPYIEKAVANRHGGASKAVAISYEFIDYDTLSIRFRVLLTINIDLEEVYEVTFDTSYGEFSEDSTTIVPYTPLYFARS